MTLQQFVQNGSQPALEELIRRHLSMVYAAAALREVADPHLAGDVTQAVFIVLMRRASHISSRIVLAGSRYSIRCVSSRPTQRNECSPQSSRAEGSGSCATSYSNTTASVHGNRSCRCLTMHWRRFRKNIVMHL